MMNELKDNVKALLSMSPTTIKKYRRELGLVKQRTRLTKAQYEQIATLREEGMSHGQIAEALGIKPNTVGVVLSRKNCLKGFQVQKGIPVLELFEKTAANRFISCAWTRANIETVFQGAQ
ncbi:hypothetical protein [Endozoicomonas acroporae]|uniref:hypothetical protein n=1 Tax=Endozoicomonas acroporae TaxID=1701104 RepID=UPI003D792417